MYLYFESCNKRVDIISLSAFVIIGNINIKIESFVTHLLFQSKTLISLILV